MTHTSIELPEALRLANSLEGWHCPPPPVLEASVAELRRLHADNEALKKVIYEAQSHIKDAAYSMAFKVLHSTSGITQEKQG